MGKMFIKASNIFKVYYASNKINDVLSFWDIVIGKFKNKLFTKKSIIALNNVSLEIHEGERVGIIGRNGAGKTTLLQIIAGLSEPSSGKIEVNGKVDCIMGLGIGLREELTGRDNIFLEGELKGKTHKEINQIIDEIIAFADIGEFIDYPVRTYSSGMKARLAFAMLTFIEPEILIIDEALSVGDTKFSQKATLKIKEICSKGKILVVVSHSMQSIIDICNRCIWLDKGCIVMDGEPKEVTEAYFEYVRQNDEIELQKKFYKQLCNKISYCQECSIESIDFLDNKKRSRKIFNVGEDLTIRISVKSNKCIEHPDIQIIFNRSDGICVIKNSMVNDGFDPRPIDGLAVFEIYMKPLLLGKGTYEVRIELIDRKSIYQGYNGQLLAAMSSLLIVDNPQYPYENPTYWWPINWSIEEVKLTKCNF